MVDEVRQLNAQRIANEILRATSEEDAEDVAMAVGMVIGYMAKHTNVDTSKALEIISYVATRYVPHEASDV